MKEVVQNLRIEDYDYELPQERIAKYPLSPRDSSKLLKFANSEISDHRYYELPELLPENSLLLFNQTRVVQARLKFPKNETTTIEVFCLEPTGDMDIQQAMAGGSPMRYQCLVGGARKWKSGYLEIVLADGTYLRAEKLDRTPEGTFEIEFSWNSERHFAAILDEAGKTPLPPYLNREAEDADKETYQTLFARNDGSVAAPTAGLHFTEDLLQKLDDSGFDREFITLHVGAGTFKPVSSEKVADHHMHYEEFFINTGLIDKLLNALERPIIPVGTTSLRALESIYWLGVQIIQGRANSSAYAISQWEPYELTASISVVEALNAVKERIISHNGVLRAKTQLIIAPGYSHKICSGLLTNFHQPKSTLLLLIASFIGNSWKDVYAHALENDYRFLSYGDGCVILKK